jgi:predicted signal transduction protein with EAL and GGDEF domain
VIEEACRQLVLWNKAATTPVRIAVNASPLQLMRSDFAMEVQQAILESGADPALLEIEKTANLMEDPFAAGLKSVAMAVVHHVAEQTLHELNLTHLRGKFFQFLRRESLPSLRRGRSFDEARQ